MSYMRELIEHSDAELIEELERRADRRARGLCDYCEHPLGMPIARSLKERGTQEEGNAAGASQKLIDRMDPKAVCRFPDRHANEVPTVWALTFSRLAGINRTRCDKWHRGMLDWNAADWSNAMQGEAGEAGNKVKKLRRLETQVAPRGSGWREEHSTLVEEIMEEIADTILYADLLAHHFGRDLEPYIVAKFNKVSEERGFEERL